MKFLTVVCFLAVCAASMAGSVRQGATCADWNGDGIITNYEYKRWSDAVAEYKKTATIFRFTGPIKTETFAATLQELSEKYPLARMTKTSVSNAVEFADDDKNGVIDAEEFDAWYEAATSYIASALRNRMTGSDNVITKEGFTSTLQELFDEGTNISVSPQ